MHRKTPGQIVIVGLLMVIGATWFQLPCAAQPAQGTQEEKPEHLITMALEYPGIEIPLEKKVAMDIIFNNKGRSDENAEVWIASQPEGWTTKIKTYKFTVKGIYVPSGEKKTITFEAEPDKGLQPGTYEFQLEAKTRGGISMAETLLVTTKEEKEEVKTTTDIKLSTTYPVLRGPTDGKFEFSIDINNEMGEDKTFDLFAEGPEGWEMNFKPAYEAKYISSLQIQANQNRNVAIEVKPAVAATAGEYPITVRVSSGEAKAEIDLMVMLTGTYKLDAGTPNDLLSLDAKPGQPANVSIYIKNSGSAPNQNIKFMSFKPENWTVEFKPEKLDLLKPNEVKQIEVIITPYKEALVGDYSVAMSIEGERATKTLEFRTTVKASAMWGWIGIGIIVVVILGLTALFRKLGRR